MDKQVKVIVLAAGYGKRMQSELPKVLVPLNGKPLVMHLLESIKESGVCDRPVIVVGQQRELVMKTLGDSYDYVVQEEQLGTGHAVMQARELLENNAENIIVLYGDNPFITGATIKKLAAKHLASGKKITMATIKLPDFSDWRDVFYVSFSRVLRDANGKIIGSVEKRDANEEELKILEVNPCYYCFNAEWMWNNLNKVKNENVQKEYYINDLLKIAIEQGEEIESIEVDAQEALSANSKAELEVLEKFIK